jgi:hypothetical protein
MKRDSVTIVWSLFRPVSTEKDFDPRISPLSADGFWHEAFPSRAVRRWWLLAPLPALRGYTTHGKDGS